MQQQRAILIKSSRTSFTQTNMEISAPETEMVQEDKCHYIYATALETNQIYSDLTGRIPTTSLSGNKYMLILYDYDSNIILSAPMKKGVTKRWYERLISSSSP
jgi:hypothetical protein